MNCIQYMKPGGTAQHSDATYVHVPTAGAVQHPLLTDPRYLAWAEKQEDPTVEKYLKFLEETNSYDGDLNNADLPASAHKHSPQYLEQFAKEQAELQAKTNAVMSTVGMLGGFGIAGALAPMGAAALGASLGAGDYFDVANAGSPDWNPGWKRTTEAYNDLQSGEVLDPTILAGNVARDALDVVGMISPAVRPVQQQVRGITLARQLDKNINSTILPTQVPVISPKASTVPQFPLSKSSIVRLYRVSNPQTIPGQSFKPKYEGMWFTSDLSKIQDYGSQTLLHNYTKGPLKLEYIDIPAADLPKYSTMRLIPGTQEATADNFLIPKNLFRRSIPLRWEYSDGKFQFLIPDPLPVPAYDAVPIMSTKKPKLTYGEQVGLSKHQRHPASHAIDDEFGNLRFIRNLEGLPTVLDDGTILLAPRRNLFVNMTSDLPFRTHAQYQDIPGSTFLRIHPRAFKGRVFGGITPSDTFLLNKSVDPRFVTVISGDVDILTKAQKAGMRVYTTPRLTELYQQAKQHAHLLEHRDFNIAFADDIMSELHRAYPQLVTEAKPLGTMYRQEVDRIFTEDFGRPTFEDYQNLERATGLKSGVRIYSPDHAKAKIENAGILDPTFDENFFKHVVYTPASAIEAGITQSIGWWPHPVKVGVYEDNSTIRKFKRYLGSKPLKKSGGKLNYLNYFQHE